MFLHRRSRALEWDLGWWGPVGPVLAAWWAQESELVSETALGGALVVVLAWVHGKVLVWPSVST